MGRGKAIVSICEPAEFEKVKDILAKTMMQW